MSIAPFAMRISLCLALLTGCGDPWIEPIYQPMVDDPPFEIWEAELQLGTVLVSEQRDHGRQFGLILGRFDPAGDRGWEVMIAEEGDCRLYSRGSFFCEPACTEGVCVDGECRPFNSLVEVGDLVVDGLASDYSMDLANAFVGFGLRSPVYVGHTRGAEKELFDGGSSIEVTAEGSTAFPSFAGSARGVEELLADIIPGDHLQLPFMRDHEVQWTPGGDDTRVRLTLRGAELGHGSPPKDKLVCDVPDTGRLTVPGALLARLPEFVLPVEHELGCVGRCPWTPSSLARYRRSSVPVGDGTVEIVVASEILFWAGHPDR
jgi:hypothetical protein